MYSSRGSAFTLVEMLVVIGIIAVLVAILYPVFSSARVKARQTQCIGQLQQVIVALKTYAEDHRGYPPAPAYDGTRFWGGVSALWPDYISDMSTLFCPEDLGAKSKNKDAKDKVYSSYNANFDLMTDPSTWAVGLLPDRVYNYYGYDDTGYDVYDDTTYVRPTPAAPDPPWWLDRTKGLGWRHYPRLMNRYAPDNTIALHCPFHRHHYDDANKRDVVIRLGGEAKVIHLSEMAATISGPGGVTANVWVHQR